MLRRLPGSLCFFLFFLGLPSVHRAQSADTWDIVRCVDHARKNNISIRQQDIQARFAALAYTQNKAAQLPSLNFGTSVGYRLGRSENPTTGVLEDNNFLNLGMQLQSQVTLFNWFSRRNTIEASRISLEAERQQVKKVQDDVSLNVAVAYLQILLAREQARLSQVQLALTSNQLEATRKRVEAGLLPELNAAELEAQLARDSSTYVSAAASVQQFVLQMKALLALDAATPFEVATPPVDLIPVLPLAELQPDAVYALALQALPQQKVNELRVQSAQKSLAAARGAMYPTINAFGGLATNAISFKRAIYDQVITGYSASGARANAGGGTFYPVEIPRVVDGTNIVGYFRPDKLGRQINNNFGQSVGISLNMPLFNARSARTAWERSKLSLEQARLTQQQGDLQLKQDIYRAYNDATAALQKYQADMKTLTTTAKAYEFASKRYDVNLLSAFDLLNSQNNLQRARIQALYSQFDYVFKMKLLEFYRGQGLKL